MVNYFFFPCAIIHSVRCIKAGSADREREWNAWQNVRTIYVTKEPSPLSLSLSSLRSSVYYFPRRIVRSPVTTRGIITHDKRVPWNTLGKNITGSGGIRRIHECQHIIRCHPPPAIFLYIKSHTQKLHTKSGKKSYVVSHYNLHKTLV